MLHMEPLTETPNSTAQESLLQGLLSAGASVGMKRVCVAGYYRRNIGLGNDPAAVVEPWSSHCQEKAGSLSAVEK